MGGGSLRRNRSTLAAAAANLGAAEENLHSVQAALAAEIAITYTNLRANEARLDVLRRNIKTRERNRPDRHLAPAGRRGRFARIQPGRTAAWNPGPRRASPRSSSPSPRPATSSPCSAGRTPGSPRRHASSGGRDIPDPVPQPRRRHPRRHAAPAPGRPHRRLSGARRRRQHPRRRCRALPVARPVRLARPQHRSAPPRSSTRETTAANLVAGLTGPIFDAGRIRANIEAQSAVERAGHPGLPLHRAHRAVGNRERAHRLPPLRRTPRHPGKSHPPRPRGRRTRPPALPGRRDRLPRRCSIPSARCSVWRTACFTTRTDRTTAYIRLYQALGGGWSP